VKTDGLGVSGRSEETEAHVREALRLSPRDIEAHIWIAFSGVAKLYLDQDQEAVARLRRATGINTNFSIAHFMLAAALARLDRVKEARAAVEAGLAVDPLFTSFASARPRRATIRRISRSISACATA
jgi:Flp pilus assembly protein TadD